ncbi:MAG: hypothetical protein KF767_12695 [Bdellovibrionaceae bacterium]|nr:hypothetical protein [Pseudobdellovibrionaceae bacterium]
MKDGSQNAMRAIGRFIKMFVGAIVIVIVGYGVVQWYPYIFSKKVDGVLQQVQNTQLNVALMQSAQNAGDMSRQLLSFSISVRQDDGEIITAETDNRQWAATRPGNCVTATFYPYPPWRFDKSGMFFNARLDKQYECPDRLQKVGGQQAIDKLNERAPTPEQLSPTATPEVPVNPNQTM